MAALTLSRAEYLVILDILHANHIFGLEARQLVRVESGRHIIERRLLELGAVVARPQLAIMTIRDRTGVGRQLYTHYRAGEKVVEQVLPDDDYPALWIGASNSDSVTSAGKHFYRAKDHWRCIHQWRRVLSVKCRWFFDGDLET